ncbi:gamma-glutamyl-gamma-aminobutyrate hydrolase family protein [Patescibacteria group bacterium]|nr:gamma-glutamyl-gamma-aminobutyrate hydrolase family protein [Patescibacteria group bacterium]
MRIAISQRSITHEQGARLDALEQDYIRYYQTFGYTLIPIPNVLNDPDSYLSSIGIQGIILSGGGDVHPSLYGHPAASTGSYMPERDRTERLLVQYAIDHAIPLFGECRGAQFLNVFFGGSLIEDLVEYLPHAMSHVQTQHIVTFHPNDRLPNLPPGTETNSYHRHGFTEKELAPNLRPFASTGDGVIEGFIHASMPIIGIQWHPERGKPDDSTTSLIKTLFR